jgi:scyllo-inositol 2-dehydrogenase (NADP+)
MGDRITVGLIGYGTAGAVYHAPLITSEPRLRLKSVATSRSEKLAKDLPGVTAVSVEAIFADPEIELIVVASPNQTHFPLAKRGLEAGKHVVVDKPFTITLSETDKLISLAERNGRLLSVFQNRRWDGDFRTVQKLVKEQAVGTHVYFESKFERFRPVVSTNWREEAGPGSGLYYDLGPHLIDQALILFGMPKTIIADITRLRPSAMTEDFFHVILQYEGFRAILHGSNLVYCPGPRFTLLGDRGSFYKFELDVQERHLKEGMRPGMPNWGLAPIESEGMLYLADRTEHPVPTLPGIYQAYYSGIADALLAGAMPPVTPQQARDVMVVLDAGLRSAREGHTVALGS